MPHPLCAGFTRSTDMLYQIGRLLFPELINRPRAMRFRMLVIFVALGLILVGSVTGVVFKVSRSGGGPAGIVKPIQ